MRFSLLRSLAVLAAATLFSAPLAAQVETPHLRWKTFETENFRIHYEPELEAWARQVAERMESVRSAVAGRVGYTFPRKIDLLVEDPLNVSNGSAFPVLTYPSMRFWATPPSPNSAIGNSRGWGEILSVHEYAHLAHLLRPSRKPFSLPVGIIGLVPLAPLSMGPAWVAEGYATLIEGELTGSGRPNAAFRPAIIRTLALEGYLPAYGQLDATDRFNGGAMRYLIGSAYLEWLQAQAPQSDSVLPQLWRRATARVGRNFPAAFTATFGESPDVLYGQFSAEVTEKAIAVRNQIQRNGLAQGSLVQKWNWGVGAPDVSPDGSRIALRRATNTDPGGIVVLAFEPDTAAQRRDSTAVAKRLKKDPEDLAAVNIYPRPLKRSAILRPVNGNAYTAPRWMHDGERILVTRSVPLADGRARSDLFEWTVKGNRVRRITSGTGIQAADPLPNGTQAVAEQCGAGVCSLLLVELASGETKVLAQGTLDGSYAGARVSPNGRFVVTARQRGSRWVPLVITIADGNQRNVGPDDDASRYSGTWENDSTLLVMSDASGAIEIERIALSGGARSVAVRTLGVASAPDVGPDGRIWWLDLHGRGWDLRVNDANSSLPLSAPLDTANFPATKRVNTSLARQFEAQTLPAPSRYGTGPFGLAFLALGTDGADGSTWAAGASFGDPVGRGTGFLYAGSGTNGAWNGARAAYAWRGFRPTITLEGFTADYLPSEHPSKAGLGWENFDRRFTGALFSLDYTRAGARSSASTRLGGSIGNSVNPTLSGPQRDRTMVFAEIGSSYVFEPQPRTSMTFRWKADAAIGQADGSDFNRRSIDTRFTVQSAQGGMSLRARGGEVSDETPFSERFIVGGTASPFLDPVLLGNRIEHLGLPFGVAGGRRFGILTAETTGPIRLYHDWIVGGDEEFGESLRAIGGEFTMEIPKLSQVRIPTGNVRFGVTHSLNGPVANATRVYTSISVRP